MVRGSFEHVVVTGFTTVWVGPKEEVIEANKEDFALLRRRVVLLLVLFETGANPEAYAALLNCHVR